MKQYVGLSLSFCIQQILRGEVKPEQVAFIVPGFDMADWNNQIPSHYFQNYWSKWDRKSVENVLRLIDIRQGRQGGHNVSQGIWWPLELWNEAVLDDYEKRMWTVV